MPPLMYSNGKLPLVRHLVSGLHVVVVKLKCSHGRLRRLEHRQRNPELRYVSCLCIACLCIRLCIRLCNCRCTGLFESFIPVSLLPQPRMNAVGAWIRDPSPTAEVISHNEASQVSSEPLAPVCLPSIHDDVDLPSKLGHNYMDHNYIGH